MNKTTFKHHKYTWTFPFMMEYHNWELVGPEGGINLHFSIDPENKYFPSGGLEFHHRSGVTAPDNINCPLLGGPCWHDGTSSYAMDHLYPLIKDYLKRGEHKIIFSRLEKEYQEHFNRTEDE